MEEKNNPMKEKGLLLIGEGIAVPVTKIKGQQYTMNEIRFE